jgi:hypothetical protein
MAYVHGSYFLRGCGKLRIEAVALATLRPFRLRSCWFRSGVAATLRKEGFNRCGGVQDKARASFYEGRSSRSRAPLRQSFWLEVK